MMLLAAAHLPVAFDEAYYWTWSRAPAWSYFDHPPATAWLIAATTAVFGDNRLGLRLLSLGSCVVLALGSIATTYRIVPADRRHRAGRLVLLTLAGSLMFVVGYLPATPDPVQGAVLGVAAYLLVRAAERPAFAVGAGFLLVAGVLVKHSSALIAIGALIGLATTAEGRDLLKKPALWAGVVVGGALLVPWLAADAGGATEFQAARVFTGKSPRGPVAIPMTVGAMLLTLGVPVSIGMFVRPRGAAVRALTFGAWALLVGCAAAAWLGTGEVNWVMPALAFALPAVVSVVVGTRWDRAYGIVTAVTSVVWLVGLAHVVVPFLPIAPAKDRTMRPAGFSAIAEAAAELAAQHGATVIVTRRYQVASMMRFHLRDRIDVHELGTSRKSQFDRWTRPSVCAGDPVIAVLPNDRVPFASKPIQPAVRVPRRRGDTTIDHYVVTALRVTKSFESCRGDAR